MELKQSETFHNLARAFANECQAHMRYKFVANCARNEGFETIAGLLDKISYNEFHHARMFYAKIQEASKEPIESIEITATYPFREKWSLQDNLKFVGVDEAHEAQVAYSAFQKKAKQEGFLDVATLFGDIIKVEQKHKDIFNELYEQFQTKTLYEKPTPVVWRCNQCGHEEKSKKCFKVCPVCNAKQGFASLILKNAQNL